MKTGALNPNQIKYPTWQLVEEKNLTEAATSVTFSGLSGNTDEMYMLNARIINGYNGGSVVIVRPNNDTGANYGIQQLSAVNSSIGAYGGGGEEYFYGGYCAAQNQLVNLTMLLYAKSGYVRTVINPVAQTISGTTVEGYYFRAQSWNNTNNEITSIVVSSNGLGAGTYIALYKKVYS